MGKEFLLPTLQLHVRYFIYISMLWTLTSEKHMATQIVGSIQLLTNHKLRKLSKTFNFARKWLNLIQKRWQMQVIKRARRRTKNQKRKEEPEPMDDEPKPIKQKDPFETIPKGNFDMD